ncbi:MAG: 50S ribosomal protein L15 [Chloroherpetonaceae bacterium]
MNLHTLTPAKGSRKPKKRVGRGPGSGNGTTAGRGNKGHQARSGYTTKNFEGGQMPLYRQLPKFGFTPPNQKTVIGINVAQLEAWAKSGKIGTDMPLDAFNKLGVIGKTEYLKILGEGELTTKINVTAHAFSETAKEKIEKAGGSVTVAYRTVAEASTMKNVEFAKAVSTPKQLVDEHKKAVKARKKASAKTVKK